jgi:hypothetical protein
MGWDGMGWDDMRVVYDGEDVFLGKVTGYDMTIAGGRRYFILVHLLVLRVSGTDKLEEDGNQHDMDGESS